MPKPSFPPNYSPSNLTFSALDDLDRILEESRLKWPANYQIFRNALLHHFYRIEQGVSLGHSRDDIRTRTQVKFITARPSDYVIVYDETRRVVLPIVHGRQNFPTLFPG